MPSNQGAWLEAPKIKPLEIRTATYTSPGANEILVKNGAVAMNPIDIGIQAIGDKMFPWIKYPFILGEDVAGEVVEVGEGVTRFKTGDRVLGHAVGISKRSCKPSEGAFQEFTILRTNLASTLPSSLSYEQACVLPLGLSTAACGMFQKDYLALQYPSVTPKPTGKTLLVWGGSTSVGSNAIQLAIAAGYEVITTASPKNFDYVRKLGASEVFDYNSKSVVQDIIGALKGKTSAGAIAIGQNSLLNCMDIISASNGKKFVSQASVPTPAKMPTTMIGLVPLVLGMVSFNISVRIKTMTKSVGSKFIFASDLMANEVGAAIYESYLPAALAEGKFVAAPEPQIVGKGLDRIQQALDVLQEGVSAKKVVVSL